MNKITIKVKKIKNVALPEYKSKQASGLDIYSAEDITLKAGTFTTVSTGIAIELPDQYEAQIRPRSGLASKYGIGILNSPGTIDSDYRGEIKIILFNFSKKDFRIKKGDRIAQMVITKVIKAEIKEVQNLSSTERQEGGFGSTGI